MIALVLFAKNCEFTPELRSQIVALYLNFEENEYKIFDNSAFGYWKVTVFRPMICEDGEPERDKKGELIPNKDLTDTEQISFDYKGGIDGFINTEVLPYAPDAWVDEKKTQYVRARLLRLNDGHLLYVVKLKDNG